MHCGHWKLFSAISWSFFIPFWSFYTPFNTFYLPRLYPSFPIFSIFHPLFPSCPLVQNQKHMFIKASRNVAFENFCKKYWCWLLIILSFTWTWWNGTQKQSRTTAQKWNQKQVHPTSYNRFSQHFPWHSSRSPWLLGRCPSQMCRSSTGVNMVYSRAEQVFIFEHFFASKSFAAVREAFSNAYPDKDVPNKITIHRLATKFRDTGSVCLWQVLIKWQNSWNYGRTDLKYCINCNNEIWLQEFNIAILIPRFMREGVHVQ
jgi:hypothetical protein